MMEVPDDMGRAMDPLTPLMLSNSDQPHVILETVLTMELGTAGASATGIQGIGGQGCDSWGKPRHWWARSCHCNSSGEPRYWRAMSCQYNSSGESRHWRAKCCQYEPSGISRQRRARCCYCESGLVPRIRWARCYRWEWSTRTAANCHQYGVRVQSMVNSVREHVARTPISEDWGSVSREGMGHGRWKSKIGNLKIGRSPGPQAPQLRDHC
jgi:hypothetical protein